MTIPAEQQEVARYLQGLSGGPPRETHISAVFIGADTVWKLKKAVRLPFLDFSKPDARAHFLHRELALNKPAAPGIYRDVVAVARRSDGSLELGGDNAIDWVLRMAPVPPGDFLDVIASNGPLSPKLRDDLGDCVAAYHIRLPPLPEQDSAGMLERITQGNFQSAISAGLPRTVVADWRRQMLSAIAARREWLNERSAAGYVRRCHGDLHLGNLCLWEGKPVAFDALEFDEALATIDVGYDLCFLLMDLDVRIGREAANQVFNRYVARIGDISTFGFPLFLSQRAMIRAHVLRSMNQDEQPYLMAALSYPRPEPPIVIAIGGLQGTGKSTIARALAPELGPAPGALVLRSDEVRKRLYGIDPETRLPPEAYDNAANRRTNAALIENALAAAVSGHAVIVDATFVDPAVRRELAAAIEPTAVRFLGIWLHAPLSVLEARVGSREGDASDATIAVLHRFAEIDQGGGEWLAVDATDGIQALETVREAIRHR